MQPPWRPHSSRRLRGAALALLCPTLLFGCGETAPEGAGSDAAAQPVRPAAPARTPPEGSEVERALRPSGRPYSERREPCAVRDPLRRAWWGDLHVHSELSMDAYMWDVRGSADDTYRFALGEETRFPPLDGAGAPTRPARLERPLDFAALTDHASYLGEVALCTRPGSAAYASPNCRRYRGEGAPKGSPLGSFGARMAGIARSLATDVEIPTRHPGLCGVDGRLCMDSMRSVWQEIQEATERYYDRTAACRFTTFHGYEYTATPALSKVHHNVIFRNGELPAAPVAWVDHPDVYALWKKLRIECLEAGTGCDVLTIPHNSNLSNGRLFTPSGRDLPLEVQRDRALLRAELEPLVEISQIKGDSECRNGMFQVMGGRDEFCEFEEWRPANAEDCEEGTGSGALAAQGCVSRLDYVRYALLEGLREQRRLDINPYKLGIVAATDAHMANPGDVEEYSYQGWSGVNDDTPAKRLRRAEGPAAALSNVAASPGGLAGVWAEENSRDALFDAMKRRETFGTSGPRITARFFGGWTYPPDLCEDPDLVQQGYAGGVPMGGDLPNLPTGVDAPVFVVAALRDPGIPGHPGGLLQRAQVVKGWLDDEDRFHQAVYDVAGGPNGAGVDLDSCEPHGPGADSLCSIWRDPDFDPERRAVYYVRVLENPSCRWSWRQCLALPEGQRPPACADPSVPSTIQERLWTAPIWYERD